MSSEPLIFVDCPPSVADAIRTRVPPSGRQDRPAPVVIVALDLANATLAAANTRAADREHVMVMIVLTMRSVLQARIGRDRVCVDCLQHWVRTAQGARRDTAPAADAGTLAPETLALAAQVAAANSHATVSADDEVALIEIDAFTGLRTRHPVVRRRDCPRCRHWRAAPPADLRAHYSPRTGIVVTIEHFRERVAGMAAAGALAAAPIAGSSAVPPPAFGTFGYGPAVGDAENGCIGEALERYCATFRPIEPMRRATLDEVRPSGGADDADKADEADGANGVNDVVRRGSALDPIGVIDPRDLLLFSEAQYRDRAQRNPRLPPRHRIPEPFDPRQPIDWLAGRDLATGRAVWLPAACCLLDYPFRAGEAQFAVADLCGCACGRTDTDAILHGLLECVERDAHAIWWYNRLPRPSIDLDALGDPRLPAMAQQLAALGRRLALLDVTTDIGIQTSVGLITTVDGREPAVGTAAHPDPRVAAWKAASEAVLNWYCARGGQLPDDITHWVATASLANSPFLCAAPDEPTRPREMAEHGGRGKPGERSDASANDAGVVAALTTVTGTSAGALADALSSAISGESSAKAQLDHCIERLQRAGLRPVAIELTRPDVVVPVWRVIVPGLRHVYDRRAPGRLYDVPVRAGWLRAPLAESALNPLPCTF